MDTFEYDSMYDNGIKKTSNIQTPYESVLVQVTRGGFI